MMRIQAAFAIGVAIGWGQIAACAPVVTSTAKYHMLYAPSRDLIDYAARFGLDWVVVASSGHKAGSNEDPPVYMPGFPPLSEMRKDKSQSIEAERKRLHELMGYAKSRGLKVIFHSYEVSVPAGFSKTYPEMYSPPIKEFRDTASKEQQQLQLCVSRPEVRRLLAEKVREICETFPEIDGYCFCCNESNTTTEVWHRCELCRDIPFSRMMKYVHDAMQEGVRRSNRPVKLFFRCWGQHETDFGYAQRYDKRVQWGENEVRGKQWLPVWAKAFAPANLHFEPSRDIPAFLKLIDGQDTAFIYKATWADVNLHHPLNPWIGKYAGHDQICEMSFESSYHPGSTFYIMGREMQRRARHCRDAGVNGLCTVPVYWGANDSTGNLLHPSQCQLNELNLCIMAAVDKDPEANLEAVTAEYLRKRYGRELPAESELVKMLLDTEDVAADAMNIRGIRASDGLGNPDAFRAFLYSLLRYAPMYPDWEKRLEPSPENLKDIFREKDANVARAQQMADRIKGLQQQLSPRAFEEFSQCLGATLRMAKAYRATHKLFLTMWAMRQGYIKPTTGNLNDLHRLIADYATVYAEVPEHPDEFAWGGAGVAGTKRSGAPASLPQPPSR